MPEPSADTRPRQPDFKFEDAIRELQNIVDELEAQDFNLDQALVSYERGVAIARDCLKRLDEAELRVKELRLDNGDQS